MNNCMISSYVEFLVICDVLVLVLKLGKVSNIP